MSVPWAAVLEANFRSLAIAVDEGEAGFREGTIRAGLREAAVRRWLTEETIATYFRLAGQSNSDQRTRLTERYRFWASRLDAIDGAWLLTAAREGDESIGQMAHGRWVGPINLSCCFASGTLTILEAASETSDRIWRAGKPPQLKSERSRETRSLR